MRQASPAALRLSMWVAIRTGGGFDIPLAFSVRRGERVLFFVREEDPERGIWSDVYTVLDRPKGTDGFAKGEIMREGSALLVCRMNSFA